MPRSPSRSHAPVLGLLLLASLPCTVGCLSLGLVPKSRLTELSSRNTALQEQNRALTTRLAAVEGRAENAYGDLESAERSLALYEERLGVGQQQLANYAQERDALRKQMDGLVAAGATGSVDFTGRMRAIADGTDLLEYDSTTGVARLKTDLLFDTGDERLKPGASPVLSQLAQLLGSPNARDLRVLIVGHTDDQVLVGGDMHERFSGDNFRLSTARAHRVRDVLEQAGVEASRIGVSGYGPYQPIARNAIQEGRRRNRRVEVYVMPPTVPVIGCSETTPNLY